MNKPLQAREQLECLFTLNISYHAFRVSTRTGKFAKMGRHFSSHEVWTDWKSPGKSHKIQEKSGNLFVIFSDIYNELCIIYYNGSSFQFKNHNILKLLKKSGNFCQITFRPEKEMSPAWQTARLSTHVALNVLGHIQVREFCGTVCELGIYRSDCNLALFLRFRRTMPFGSLPLEKDPVSVLNTEPKSGILDPLYGAYWFA